MTAATTAAPRAEPTREQYELAWRQRQRPHRGPTTLDAALAHPVYSICLRQLALRMGRPAWQPARVAVSLPVGPAVPPTPTQPPRTAVVRTGGAMPGGALGAWPARPPRPGRDLKRAAANDHDD